MAKAATRVAPVTRTRPIVDTSNEKIGGAGVAHMPATGAPRIVHDDEEGASAIDVARHLPKDKAERMLFDSEPVTVIVQESGDTKYPDPCISVWVNGKHQLFVRNMPITCKRMYVEALARSRPESFDNQEYVNADGVKGFRYPKRSTVKYPFQMIRDDNPRGGEWLRTLLSSR
jgi:hypothetical protein